MFRLPAYAQFEVTDLCNLRCKHCYHFDTEYMPKTKDLSDDKIFEIMTILAKSGIYSLIITGGEPLIRPQTTLMVAEEAKKSGMHVSINTNLLLITPDLIKDLKRIKINSLLISCPAGVAKDYQEITKNGNLDTFFSKLRLIVDSKISCMVNMVVTKSNHQLIKETARAIAKIGVKNFSATPCSLNVLKPNHELLLNESQTISLLEDLKWCEDELDLKTDSLEPLPKCFYPEWCWDKKYAFMNRSCQAGRMSISISNTGDIRPCSHNPTVYGNLFNESIETIWGKMDIYRKNSVPMFCQKCPTVETCNGACRTNALATSGKTDTIDRFVVNYLQKKDNETNAIDQITDTQEIHFNGTLRYRKEINGNHSVTTKNNGRNLIIINDELFNFIIWLENKLPLNLIEIKKQCHIENENEDFLRIIHFLRHKEFINTL